MAAGEEVSLFLQLVQNIGLPATTGLIGIAAWFYERRQNQILQEKLMELATAQISASLKVENALEAVKSVIAAGGARKR